MWLPKSLYESLPLLMMAAGAAALLAAFRMQQPYWPEACAGGGLFLVICGLVLMLRRKGYRTSRSRLDFDR